MRSAEQHAAARQLFSVGLSDGEVARWTGIPRRTINGWRRQPDRKSRRRAARFSAAWRPEDPHSYAYLLGMYLGDGHIAKVKGSSFIRIVLDVKYPKVIAECTAALEAVEPEGNVREYRRANYGAAILQVSSPAWPVIFPQHGRGPKHERPIELEPWQRAITHRFPRLFLRGLIHSDGSRCTNRFKTKLLSGRVAEYAYPRYFFTNVSADIRGLFREHCELLGIRVTQSNSRNLSVAHRSSVAILDGFVGPKA